MRKLPPDPPFVTGIVHKPLVTYCACLRTRGDNEGFTYDPDTLWWVHAPCGNPTRTYVEAMWFPATG